MSHPDFVDLADTDVDIDSPLTTGLFENFRQCDRALRRAVMGFHIPETTFTSATYVQLAEAYIWIPDLADFDGIQRQLLFEFEAKVTSGTATFKLVSVVDSDEPTQTATSYTSTTCTLDIAGALKGTVLYFSVQGKIAGGGTGYIKSVNRLTSLLEF
jgi:hypothetical protein